MNGLRNLELESQELLGEFQRACARPGMEVAYGPGYQERLRLANKLFVPTVTNRGQDGVVIERGDYPADGIGFLVTNGRQVQLPKEIILPTYEHRRLARVLTQNILGGMFGEINCPDGDIYSAWRPSDTLTYCGTNANQALAKCLTFEHRVMTQDGNLDESVTLFAKPLIIASNRESIRQFPSYRLGVAFHELDHAYRRLMSPAVPSASFRNDSWVDADEKMAESAQDRFQKALAETGQYDYTIPNL